MSAKARKVPQRNPAAAQLIHYNSTSPIYAGVAFLQVMQVTVSAKECLASLIIFDSLSELPVI
eukprot:scaffold263432_cov17-Tisochrysis_lutea.AAC.1